MQKKLFDIETKFRLHLNFLQKLLPKSIIYKQKSLPNSDFRKFRWLLGTRPTPRTTSRARWWTPPRGSPTPCAPSSTRTASPCTYFISRWFLQLRLGNELGNDMLGRQTFTDGGMRSLDAVLQDDPRYCGPLQKYMFPPRQKICVATPSIAASYDFRKAMASFNSSLLLLQHYWLRAA